MFFTTPCIFCNIVGLSHSQDAGRSDDEQTAIATEDEPVDIRDDIKRKFLVEMPQDFFDFWEFAKTVNSKSPSG